MTVLPGVLGCRPLRRTIKVRLGPNTLWFPGGPAIFTVSRHRFVKHPGFENIAQIMQNYNGLVLEHRQSHGWPFVGWLIRELGNQGIGELEN
jgi:hypothetical protein